MACSAVLANMYAMGVTECDNIQLSLVLSLKMNDKERDVVVPIIIEGFKVQLEKLHYKFLLQKPKNSIIKNKKVKSIFFFESSSIL